MTTDHHNPGSATAGLMMIESWTHFSRGTVNQSTNQDQGSGPVTNQRLTISSKWAQQELLWDEIRRGLESNCRSLSVFSSLNISSPTLCRIDRSCVWGAGIGSAPITELTTSRKRQRQYTCHDISSHQPLTSYLKPRAATPLCLSIPAPVCDHNVSDNDR